MSAGTEPHLKNLAGAGVKHVGHDGMRRPGVLLLNHTALRSHSRSESTWSSLPAKRALSALRLPMKIPSPDEPDEVKCITRSCTLHTDHCLELVRQLLLGVEVRDPANCSEITRVGTTDQVTNVPFSSVMGAKLIVAT